MDRDQLKRAIAIIARRPGITVGELLPLVGMANRRRAESIKQLKEKKIQVIKNPLRETPELYPPGYQPPAPKPLFQPVPGYIPPVIKRRAATVEEIGDYQAKRRRRYG